MRLFNWGDDEADRVYWATESAAELRTFVATLDERAWRMCVYVDARDSLGRSWARAFGDIADGDLAKEIGRDALGGLETHLILDVCHHAALLRCKNDFPPAADWLRGRSPRRPDGRISAPLVAVIAGGGLSFFEWEG